MNHEREKRRAVWGLGGGVSGMVKDFMIGKYFSSQSLGRESAKDVGEVGNNVHCEPVGAMAEEWVLEIHIRGHVRDCQIVDTVQRTDQCRRCSR